MTGEGSWLRRLLRITLFAAIAALLAVVFR